MLKRIGAGAAIAWSAPIVTSVVPPAHAAGSPACRLSASMDGSQEVPPRATPATGSASFSVNLVPSQVDYTYSVQNLTAQCTGAHVHRAPAGSNGPIVIDLGCPDVPTGPNSGTKSGTASVSPTLAAELCANPAGFYINVHSETYPGGEIRGQLS